MSHYVVTTADHRDALRGDCAEDCFCTRWVAEMRFESYVDAGQPIVRLIRWSDGEPRELIRHEVPPPKLKRRLLQVRWRQSLPAVGAAVVSRWRHQLAAFKQFPLQSIVR